ncbi:MAG: sensor histidine kinase, partial [Proteobacteria bacterium]|nr:sensor histidine kinase [Pseudomonadota bacterium]
MTLTRPLIRPGKPARRARVARGGGRRFAVRWHLAWAVAAALAAAALALGGPPADQALAALGAMAVAGLLGALLSDRPGETGPMLAVLAWGMAGAGAALLTGGTGGPLAAWCLAPMAAGAAFGRPKLLGLGAAAGVGAAALAALGGGLLLLPMTPAPLSTWLSLLALGTTGLGFAAGLVSLLGKVRGDDARARETELQLREALDHQPQLLLAVYPGGRILEAFGEAPVGVSIHELAGLNLMELASPEAREALGAALREAADDGAAELMFTPAHDAQGWCALSLRRLNDMRLVAAVRDARAQRQRE